MKSKASPQNRSTTTKSLSDAIFKTAKWCIGRGYSVIPVKKSDKRPHIKWVEYQKRLPTHEEIKDWYRQWPNANIALITGALSGIMIVDVDTEAGQENLNEFLPDSLIIPTTRTPGGGWHYFFKYKPGLSNKARVIEGVDVRTDGGYAVIPPSLGPNNKNYTWLKGLKITDVEMPEIPDFLFDILKQGSGDHILTYNALNKGINPRGEKTASNIIQHPVASGNISFLKGERDQSLFHTANSLIRGGMNEVNVRNVLHILSSACDPPFPEAEANLKIQSAMDRAKKRDVGLTREIREWCLLTSGSFPITSCYNSLNIVTPSTKNKASTIFSRLCEEGIVEKVGTKRGEYRLVERDLEFLDLTSAVGETTDIWLPVNLNHIARIFPGNMIVVAGAPNCGKTAFMLSCCRYNMKHRRVRYLSSEMGIEEAADRIGEFDIPVKEWQRHWEFAERYDNFQDSLLKGKGDINIIDYLEQPEGEAYRAASQLTQIDKNLGDAIAIVALQKNRGKGRDTGVGGDQTLAKPRLYLAIDYGWMKIVKCKAFEKAFGNPNWMEINFKLVAGYNFVMDGDWTRVEK